MRFDSVSLWNYVWSNYRHAMGASSLDVKSLLKEFHPPIDEIRKTKRVIRKHHDRLILKIFEAIVSGDNQIEVFDRSSAETFAPGRIKDRIPLLPIVHDYYEKFLRQLEHVRKQQTSKHIRPLKKSGHPVDIIIDKAQTEDILGPLQVTYYYFVAQNGRNPLIDVITISCCLMNIDMAYETISHKDKLVELVLYSLKKGTDIRSSLPFKLKNIKGIYDHDDLRERHATLIKRQEDKRRRDRAMRKGQDGRKG